MRLKVRTLAGMLATLLLLGVIVYRELPSLLYHTGYYQALLQWFPNDENARPAMNRLAMDMIQNLEGGETDYIFIRSSGGASSSGPSSSKRLAFEQRTAAIDKLEKLLTQYGHTQQTSNVAYRLALTHFWSGNWNRAEQLLREIDSRGDEGWFSSDELEKYLAILESRHHRAGEEASLEGVVRIGDKVVPNAFVYVQRADLTTYYSPPLTYYPATITDENGQYRFYNLEPGDYQIGVGVRKEQISGYYMTELEAEKTVVGGAATAVQNVQFVPQVIAISPARKEIIQGDELRLQWQPYEGAAYYMLNISSIHRDRIGKYSGATTTSISEDRFTGYEAVFSIRELNRDNNMIGKSYGQNREVTLNTAGLLGMLYPGGEFAWSVDAYDEHDRKLSSSAGYFLHEDAVTPIFRVAEADIQKGDRLVMEARYEEAIEAYKREGDNDHALRILARLADQGIGAEDGDQREALSYMERIQDPWDSDHTFMDWLRERISKQK
ncbi:carboxypeptidase-like regulatory domain-containing protein [Paenibacillus paeoniae]|uniref:Carboxypeptidase regulatory-like domain-containing protein n=1 Tax=Paenibacillus paeoniae TaxID=2292705 RepID=A0A371P0Y5_9BACL|nr:carboxypeptidase-like regulatory domain-containing protein [Paenibacillus paeoniae]REK69612.1 carboxypeptidase regulatory-like domain-containing protein [Paenibacillus paeoniae]